MPEVVTCPQCERQLRVPDELLGQRVKCPTCGTNFTADLGPRQSSGAGEGPRPGSGPLEPRPGGSEENLPGRRPRSDAGTEEEYGERRHDEYRGPQRDPSRRALRSLVAPGICLIVTGILGLMADLFQVIYALSVKPVAQAQVAKPTPFDEFMLELQKHQSGPLPIILGIVFGVISLITLLGGISMVRGRGYGLAMAGSILGMVNIGNCCCLLGLPFGIWSLVVLMNEDTKNAFR